MTAESEVLAADSSASIDELDDLICHIPDNRPCLSRIRLFDPLGLLDSDSNSDSDSAAMAKWSMDLVLLTWSSLSF